MTDRPDGTSEETPDESELPEAEPAVEAEPEAADVQAAGDETGDELDADDADEESYADQDGDASSFADEETAKFEAAGRPGPAPARPTWRRAAPPPSATRAPTVSEVAVQVSDPASKIFVVGTVVVFVSILLFGIFLGNGGVLSATPTPEPTAVPTASPSAAPSASVSVSPSGSASAAPSGSGSAAPSASAAPSLSPSPS